MFKLILLLATIFTANAASAELNLKQTEDALAVISNFANTMCADPKYEGRQTTTNAEIEAGVDINNLLKKLANVNAHAGAEVKTEAYQGLLRKDLLAAMQDASKCRLEIYNDLKLRLLPNLTATPSHEKSSPPVQPDENGAPASVPFAKLAKFFGLPPGSQVGWDSPIEDIEKLVPASERKISRVDLIAVDGKATINSIPATTSFVFQNRKLTSIRLSATTWYSTFEQGNRYHATTTSSRTDGNATLGKRMCNADFIRELERKMDGLFSKTKNLNHNYRLNSDFNPQSFGCKKYGCQSKSESDIWTIGYKDPEANEIEVQHQVNQTHYSYEDDKFNVGEEDATGCTTTLTFSNKNLGGF